MSKSNTKKVYVGLSGGVDSSVSALLLKKAGYDVTGVFIKVWQPDWINCTWKEDRIDAMRICAALNIPFITLDLEKEYKKDVVDYMINEYKAGRTPNPDVMCNKYVKFGAFFDYAMNAGADYVATGHYAQVKKIGDTFALLKGKDDNKDQSYFLWTLNQKQLSHTLFPIGHLEKPKVRKIAETYNLITADKKDSQGLCFIGKIDMKDFLKEYISEKKGDVINENGEIVGTHDGAVFYTIGERHGFSITKKGINEKPYYVISKDIDKNILIVSHDSPKHNLQNEVKEIDISSCNWTRLTPEFEQKYTARGRYRQELVDCKIEKLEKDSAGVVFDRNDTTLTSGQSLVIYNNGECIGGGIIE